MDKAARVYTYIIAGSSLAGGLYSVYNYNMGVPIAMGIGNRSIDVNNFSTFIAGALGGAVIATYPISYLFGCRITSTPPTS
jgi:hypothetical protein